MTGTQMQTITLGFKIVHKYFTARERISHDHYPTKNKEKKSVRAEKGMRCPICTLGRYTHFLVLGSGPR